MSILLNSLHEYFARLGAACAANSFVVRWTRSAGLFGTRKILTQEPEYRSEPERLHFGVLITC